MPLNDERRGTGADDETTGHNFESNGEEDQLAGSGVALLKFVPSSQIYFGTDYPVEPIAFHGRQSA